MSGVSNSYYEILTIHNKLSANFVKNDLGKHWTDRLWKFESGTNISLAQLLNFRSNSGLSLGLDDKANLIDTKNVYDNLILKWPMKEIINLSETSIGNPEAHSVNGISINYHDLFLINYALDIYKYCHKRERLRILEIGGGYGGLAYKLKKLMPDSIIYLIDIPQSLTLTRFYLSQLNPSFRFRYSSDIDNHFSDSNVDFVLLLPNEVFKVNEVHYDLVINTRSMMEMPYRYIEFYFDLIQKQIKVNGIFYLSNRYRKDTSGEKIKLRNYPYDNYWVLIDQYKSFMQNHIHTIVSERVNIENSSLKSFLMNLTDSSHASFINPRVLNESRFSTHKLFKILVLLYFNSRLSCFISQILRKLNN